MTTSINIIDQFRFIDHLHTTARQLVVFSAIVETLNSKNLPKMLLEKLLINWSIEEGKISSEYKKSKGRITNDEDKSTSALRYHIELSTSLGLTKKVDTTYTNTKISQTFLSFLNEEIQLSDGLSIKEKCFFLFQLLNVDADGVILALSQLDIGNQKSQVLLQNEFKSALNERLLTKMELAKGSAKNSISTKYRTINFIWKKAAKYAEHLIAPRYEWLSSLGLVDIVQIRNILRRNSEQDLIKYLTPIASREYAKALFLIGSEDEEISDLMNRFLYAGLTKTELKKLGLAKSLQTDLDSIRFLSGLLSCFMGNSEIIDGKVVLWMDEMEDLIYYSPKNYRAFSQLMRDMFDSFPNRFLAFLNFTLAEGEENTIEIILGGALWSRITKKIRYKQFSLADAEKYCYDLLAKAKIDKNISNPFDSELITEVINIITPSNLTPREINKYFSSLISYTLDHNLRSISQNTLNRWMQEYSDDN